MHSEESKGKKQKKKKSFGPSQVKMVWAQIDALKHFDAFQILFYSHEKILLFQIWANWSCLFFYMWMVHIRIFIRNMAGPLFVEQQEKGKSHLERTFSDTFRFPRTVMINWENFQNSAVSKKVQISESTKWEFLGSLDFGNPAAFSSKTNQPSQHAVMFAKEPREVCYRIQCLNGGLDAWKGKATRNNRQKNSVHYHAAI